MEFYHDFSVLGLSLPQRSGIFPLNQQAKGPLLTGYLLFAIGKLKARGVSPLSVAELFCADAYYSCIARRFGAEKCDAFDDGSQGHMAEAAAAIEHTNSTHVHLHQMKVHDIPSDFRASLVINAGGLYHVEDPLRALDASYQMADHYLIVQSVVSLSNQDATYFETPAPEWTYGSRFSAAFLEAKIRERGWHIVDMDANELTGNSRPEDRGSAYFLIAKGQ